MKDIKLFIDTLEKCNDLIGKCVEAMKVMSEELDKAEADYTEMADCVVEQAKENSELKRKISNILNGIGVNK